MRLNIKKIVGLSFVGLLAFSATIVPSASAKVETSWGPQDRATFTWAAPATYPTFNSITDNPFIGDERNFVRIKEYGTEDNYSDDVYLEDGKEYEIKVDFTNLTSFDEKQASTILLKGNYAFKLGNSSNNLLNRFLSKNISNDSK